MMCGNFRNSFNISLFGTAIVGFFFFQNLTTTKIHELVDLNNLSRVALFIKSDVPFL